MDSMSWYNPLAGWIGWVALAVIVIGFGYLWYRQRKNKSRDTRTHRWVPVDGFGTLWIPLYLTKDEGDDMVIQLHITQLFVWEACQRYYKLTDEYMPAWYIDTIGVGANHPPEHQYVAYYPGAHRIRVKDDPQMCYWFAREIHNVFRIFLHGLPHVYDVTSEEDLENAHMVQLRIKDTYWQEAWDEVVED